MTDNSYVVDGYANKLVGTHDYNGSTGWVLTIPDNKLTTGTNDIFVSFSPTGSEKGYNNSTTVTVPRTASVEVSLSSTSGVVGQAVQLTAFVSPAAALFSTADPGNVPESFNMGSVTFFSGTTPVASRPVEGLNLGSTTTPVFNVAPVVVSAVLPEALGKQTITAVYSYSSLPSVTSASVSYDVRPAMTMTTVEAAPNPVLLGNAVTLTATVGVKTPGSGQAHRHRDFLRPQQSAGPGDAQHDGRRDHGDPDHGGAAPGRRCDYRRVSGQHRLCKQHEPHGDRNCRDRHAHDAARHAQRGGGGGLRHTDRDGGREGAGERPADRLRNLL